MRKPEVTIAEMNVKIGRATLSKLQRIDSENALSFGLTREHCQLLERISACALRNESVLLTGETGVGKTSVIQLLASYMNASLRVVNMSQDSDTSDLIGGYKPVSIITIIRPLFEDYETLFDQTFDRAKNVKFFTHLQNCLSTGRFADFLRLLIETALKAIEQPKTDHFSWTKLIVRAKRILHSLSSRKSALPFAYIRGIVSEAAELGHWLLIDEINLASPDCLESVVRVLEGTLS
uniref:ATPase dynein-related AAA domain-containing protein n=1 Tax=Acrobeloides nanus TaxID=290746 RepID=A0A914D8T6_9BILA